MRRETVVQLRNDYDRMSRQLKTARSQAAASGALKKEVADLRFRLVMGNSEGTEASVADEWSALKDSLTAQLQEAEERATQLQSQLEAAQASEVDAGTVGQAAQAEMARVSEALRMSEARVRALEEERNALQSEMEPLQAAAASAAAAATKGTGAALLW